MSNKITLAAAMETLKSMFPTYDPKTIKDILYRTNGHMEQTIELLLQIQNSVPSAPPVAEPEEAPISHRHPTDESHIHHSLPSDFLRYDFDDVAPVVAPSPRATGNTNNNTARHQMAEDEKLALQLQRQMLFEESLSNAGLLPSQPKRPTPSVNASVNSRHTESHGNSNSNNKHFSTQGIGSKPASGNPQSSGSVLTQNVQKLSEIAKKKLAEFRTKFSRQGASNSGNRKEQGPAYSSLLANNNSADDDDDNEFSGGLGNNRL